jgi:proteasome lid subunit RPN8/RPN11
VRLVIGEGLLQETFATLRRCGQESRECAVWWTSAIGSQYLDELIHPKHSAGPGFYEITSEELHRHWLELAQRQRSIQVQVHTHPGSAYHSGTDDQFAVIRHPGALSLVIPDFAAGPISLGGTFLAELDARGRWQPVPLGEKLTT